MLIRALSFLFSTALGLGAGLAEPASVTENPPTTPPVVVVGFMGGRVRHDNLVHSGVQMAARLRADYGVGVHVEVFEDWSMGAGVRRFLRR